MSVMQRAFRNAFALVLLIGSVACGQPIELVGPSQPLDHWRNATIAVVGVEPEEAGRCEVTCTPDTAAIRKLRDWSGRPVLDFESGTAGTYTITVTMHGWSQTLHDALDELETAADRAELSDPDTATLTKAVADLTTLVSQFDETYPLRTGSCVVEVTGVIKPPVEPPVKPPVEPPKDIRQAVYLYERDDGPVPAEITQAIKEVNEEDEIEAVPFESSETGLPERYAQAHQAGVKFGLPCLVLVGSDGVVKCVKVSSYAEFMEALNDG